MKGTIRRAVLTVTALGLCAGVTYMYAGVHPGNAPLGAWIPLAVAVGLLGLSTTMPRT